MRKAPLFALALAIAACRAKPHPMAYADPSGLFRCEVPDTWRRDGDKDLSRKPVAVISFIGEVQSQDEGLPLGAVINVTRISRNKADVPGGDKGYAVFQKNWLLRSDALFGGPKDALPDNQKPVLALTISDETIGGLKARVFRQDYAQGNPIHNTNAPPMRLEDAVVQTPEAYYVLEYRATKDLFDKHYGVYQRLKAAAVFGKAS
jgi:hypothetical protein